MWRRCRDRRCRPGRPPAKERRRRRRWWPDRARRAGRRRRPLPAPAPWPPPAAGAGRQIAGLAPGLRGPPAPGPPPPSASRGPTAAGERRSYHQPPADVDGLAGQIRGLGRGQVGHQRRYLVGGGQTAHGHVGQKAGQPAPAAHRLQHGGVGVAGSHGVDLDATRAVGAGQGAGEAHHPGLGCRVVDAIPLAGQGSQGRDIDDGAATGGQHPFQGAASAEPRPHQVGTQHPRQLLVGQQAEEVEGGAGLGALARLRVHLPASDGELDAGVVHQHGDGAEALLGLAEHVVHLSRIAHVGGDGQGHCAPGAQGSGHRLRPLGLEVVDRHQGALGGQPPADGLADAGAAAGHQGDPTGEASRTGGGGMGWRGRHRRALTRPTSSRLRPWL